MEWFMGLSPVIQGLLATLFTYTVTALGASLVFFFRSVDKRILDLMMGFGSGVMIAASFWSLLAPSIDRARELNMPVWLVTSLGFFCGGGIIIVADKLLSKSSYIKCAEGGGYKRCILLFSAVTLHNIPEGLAVGVAFGSVAQNCEGASITGALLLALGIGIQNFPEGTCISLPLKREGVSTGKAFFWGQLSGVVEPIAGVLGVVLVMTATNVLPFLLAFSAGAMISVVASELIPESASSNKNLATFGLIIGFIVMMVLDVTLG